MTESTTDRQHGRALRSLLGKGIAVTAIGVPCSMAPQLLAGYFKPFGPTESLATGIRVLGLILLLIGVATLLVRHAVRNRMDKLSNLRRGGGAPERMNYATRGAPLNLARDFPVATDASQVTRRQWHSPLS